MGEAYGSPKGECYRWSMNLASEILEKTWFEVYIVIGELRLREDVFASHTWLNCGDLSVDITADQFNARASRKFPKVLVSPSTSLKDYRPHKARLVKDCSVKKIRCGGLPFRRFARSFGWED